ncbi:synaptotagmin-like protein 1 isoform X3 [Pimephales promelas]|uniref:synaptotagmin-like protein 1 isoform X3 n=1 Tax=Pimephales promelas TaxID=90988 RepID=UPI001955EB07|nr:synaptotagmin-like protein 1 isoform X3 [Pimephales promelas]KAG1973039.1 synaptotagmin-like protein 2 isoform b [Pimephales promelas]KAG1973040.1 synaptotagmin-like protein 2 isoform b [Pimephales promelas]
MKQSKSASELIDLSFLSAEEEAAIRQVLLRDEDLKRLDSGRVRKLRQSVPDLQKLKTLTGEWFEDLRVKRYGLQTDVTAVVRTSMRWKKTAAHKTNPFLNDIVDENKEHEKEEHSTPTNPFADPRLIHPALSKETHHQHTDDDFTDDEASSTPRVSDRKIKLQAEIDGNHVLNGNDPKHNSKEAQPKQLSDDQITTIFPFSKAVQDTKPERGPAKHETNREPRRKVSLPPALQKDQSFEENWVKISLEPNAVKPVHDESNNVEPELKEGKDASTDSGDDVPVEIGKDKTSNKKEPLLQNKTADVSVNTIGSVSDKTVQRLLDALEGKEKTKLAKDQNLPKDTHTRKLSQEHLSVMDDGKLVHIKDAGLHVDSEHIAKSSIEPIQPAKSTSEDDAGLGQGSSELKDDEDSQRARLPVLQKITAQEPKQEIRDGTVPTIVIIPSKSPDPTELKGSKHGVSIIEALLEASTCKTPSYTADAWKDEGVDSDDDDDDTSLSSYGSDLSGRKGYSASALSLTDRTNSLLSVYSDAGDFGNVEVQGSVEFAVMYSPVGELIIMIEQCQDLAIANPRKHRTDPYVKTYLYPDKSRRSKRKTSIKKRTVNPVFVESLRYKVRREELPEKTLNLSVWHNDSRGRNVFLGQVEISLKTWDWGHEALTWYNLQSTTAENQESQESNGFLSVSLKYVPQESTGGSKNSTGEIHVWLREATELRGLKPQGVDSFVKCYILPDTRKKSRQKTRVVKKSQNPVYNHAMVYDGFKAGEVSEACCELTVWDHNKLSNQFLGGLRLSLGTGKSYGKKVDWMDSLNEEVQIWKRMLANPNCWVEGELPLRSSMTPRK